jgi:hypothetical protein
VSDRSFWVIYKNPSDVPMPYVVREWRIVNGVPHASPNGQTAATIDDARTMIPGDRASLGRAQDDDPAIDEVWV